MEKFGKRETCWNINRKKNPTKYGRPFKYLIVVRQLTTHRLKDYSLQRTL